MRHSRQHGNPLRVLACVLLLFLLAFSGAQAAHFHLDNVQDAHCDLCLLAHHATVPQLQITIVAANASVTPLWVHDPQPLSTRVVLATRIRPPPPASR